MVFQSDKHVRIGVRDGQCVGINEVECGRKCGCVCAACGHQLVAKQGEIRAWHFAHDVQSDCNNMGETHIHLAAKQILRDRKKLSCRLSMAGNTSPAPFCAVPCCPFRSGYEDLHGELTGRKDSFIVYTNCISIKSASLLGKHRGQGF